MYYEILDYILPSSDRSKHDTLRLEFLCATQVMENENNIMKTLKLIPASFFELLLQSVIYKCYLRFINNINTIAIFPEIIIPETLRILILNWPHQELVLRKQIPPLHPPVELFQKKDFPEASPKQCIPPVFDMKRVFDIFYNSLVQFITQAVFKCTPRNTYEFSSNLRKLDLSGLVGLRITDIILDGIRNSTINTFGHKIELFVDAEMGRCPQLKLLSDIIEDNLNPKFGISVYYKRVSATLGHGDGAHQAHLLSDFYATLASGRCEHIELMVYYGGGINKSYVEKLCTYLPGLVSVDLISSISISSLDCLNALEYLERVEFSGFVHNSLINSICNMSKGLKCLKLTKCSLQNKDIECLADSVHTDTLLEIGLSGNNITIDTKAIGLVMLCHKLKHVKVISVDLCSLNTLSLNSVSHLVDSYKDCIKLEFLSMRNSHPFNLDMTHIIIDGLALSKSLRYLSLSLPRPDNANKEYQHNLCKTFHDKINKYRNLPIYISWNLDEWP